MMNQRGDTIVEVIFAITIFSLVAVGGLGIMNQGTATAQRSLEISLVRDQIDAQADALRYLHDAYVATYGTTSGAAPAASSIWDSITTGVSTNKVQSLDDMAQGNTCHLPTGADGSLPFALDITKLETGTNAVIDSTKVIAEPATYSQVRYTGTSAQSEGLWIQTVKKPLAAGIPGYYDFHIRACWYTTGQDAPVTLGTIVRLYEPKP